MELVFERCDLFLLGLPLLDRQVEAILGKLPDFRLGRDFLVREFRLGIVGLEAVGPGCVKRAELGFGLGVFAVGVVQIGLELGDLRLGPFDRALKLGDLLGIARAVGLGLRCRLRRVAGRLGILPRGDQSKDRELPTRGGFLTARGQLATS